MSVDFNLRIAIFWIAALLCVIAEIAILRSMMRGSRVTPVASASDAVVPRARPATELLWAVLPAVGLVVILILTRNAIQ